MSCPANPKIELISINKDALLVICLGYPAFIKNRRGLKKIPPPIPTMPDIKPIIDPIEIEINLGILLIESKSFNKEKIKINQIPRLISISIGSIIGFMSGIVGIGGGIFLSPILFLMKAGYPRHIASSASLFILINSIFGIAGQLTKDQVLDQVIIYWPLFLSVLIGGQIGSLINIKFLSNKILALLTSFLVIFVAIRMGIKLLT